MNTAKLTKAVSATGSDRVSPQSAVGWLAGTPGIEQAQFQRRAGTWAYLAGGTRGPFDGYPLSDRPPAASQHGYLRHLAAVRCASKGTHRASWPGRRAFHAMFRASAEVHQLLVGGRVLDVPCHGDAVLTWVNRRMPAVCALARNGTRLVSLDPGKDPLGLRHRRFTGR